MLATALVRAVERVHGHLGWLAVAALVHPVLLLRHSRRSAHWSVGLSTGLVTVAGALGLGLYEPYREELRQRIFIEAPRIGFLFERKEHLAFGALVAAWVGGVVYVASLGAEEPTRDALRRVAFRAFLIACALSAVTATLGTIVASYRSF
jgi:hypothetical protein